MTRISAVWVEAIAVLARRGRTLAPVAVLAFVLPAAAASAVQVWGGGSTEAAAAGGLIALVGVVASLWGHLAVVAVAADPAGTRDTAQRLAWRRLPAVLLAALIVGGLVVALLIPVAIVLVASGLDPAAVGQGLATMPRLGVAAGLFVFLYALLLVTVGLWASARLFVLYPVVLHERPAIAAFGRTFALTRGLTVQLIGVILLFAVAGLVAASAAQAGVGIAVRLAGGSAAAALFGGGLAWSGLTAAWIVVVQVFAARLHAALVAGGAALSHA